MNTELSFEQNFEKLHNCELFLLDMDGTLYLGDEVFDGAIDFIHTLKNTGKKYIYLYIFLYVIIIIVFPLLFYLFTFIIFYSSNGTPMG